MVADYLTAANIKAFMPDAGLGSSYDSLLATICTQVSRDFDRLTGWWPGAFAATDTSARVFNGSGTLRTWIDPLAAEPTLVEMSQDGKVNSYTTITPTNDSGEPNYFLGPLNALGASERPHYLHIDFHILFGQWFSWYQFPRAVRITGAWGFSAAPPDDVVYACTIMGIRAFKRAQQSYQDAGAITDLGQLRYVKALDPEVDAIVRRVSRGIAI